jgi:hypothetical protein
VLAAQSAIARAIMARRLVTHGRAVAAGMVSSAMARITPTTRISVTIARAARASRPRNTPSAGTPATSANSSSKQTASNWRWKSSTASTIAASSTATRATYSQGTRSRLPKR